MSPILVRPVREQFEHDRVIRLLQARYKRKFEVVINPGAEQNASLMVGDLAVYPDVILFSQERGRKLQGTIEVETGESVNTLEAMAQWGVFSRLRAPFFLYVPPHSLDTARRLCTEHQVIVSEIWTYHTAADQVRFTMVHRAPEAHFARESKTARDGKEAQPKPAAAKKAAPARPEPSRAAKQAPKAAKRAKPARNLVAKKAAPVALRQAQGRSEQRRGAKKTVKTAKTAKSAKTAKTAKKAAKRR